MKQERLDLLVTSIEKCLKTFLIYIAMKYVFRQLNIKTIKREVLHCDSHYNLYRIDFMAWY